MQREELIRDGLLLALSQRYRDDPRQFLILSRQSLDSALMATNTRDQANSIETEIRAVRLALEHYRAALDVEKSISAHPT